jgi:tRNA-splicing ligase RtcB (3'-phosphate/5'-hydroxy nucleic acid ligase)
VNQIWNKENNNMFILEGKCNIAKVFLPDESFLDIETKMQILRMLNHPAFKGKPFCIMPDTHKGIGSVIGFTFKMDDYVIPNIVGVDLNCGMLSINLGKIAFSKKEFELFDDFLKKNIPVGFNINKEMNPEGIWVKENEEVEKIVLLTNQNLERVLLSIGSLGGGNHFIELGKDSKDNVWLTIHTGSRNFGLQIAQYFQKKANEFCAEYFQDFGELNFIPKSRPEYYEYLRAIQTAGYYANVNRRVISNIIIDKFFKQVFPGIEEKDSIECIHNYINLESKIIRKGAIRAEKDERVIIPFNMEDGLIIGKGLGNEKWNYSAPHGAGRILSRNKAKELLNLNDELNSMKKKGVYTTSLDESTLDESKGAYKDKDMILEMIKETVEVVEFVKPIFNFKSNKKKENRK